MDLQKEREAFQECYKTSRDYKFYVRHEMSEKQIFEFKKGKYVVDCVNDGWKIWQAAKAQAVPEGFVVVPVCEYCGGYGEVGCQFEGTFTCPECNGDRVDLKAMIEAQEPTK